MNQIAMKSSTTGIAKPILKAGYKDVMVHLDGTVEDEIRIAHAEAIAAQFEAHLTGLYTNALPDAALYAGEFGTSAIVDAYDAARRAGDAIHTRLTQRFARLGVANEVRRLESFPGLLEKDVATEARWADLIVGSCPHGTSDCERWGSLIETIMFNSGHGLYLVPPGFKPRQAIRTVLIGWVDTREAARAVSEVLPLLGLATQVHLASVQEAGKGKLGGAEALADIATHLDRHGIATTISLLPDNDTPAAMLLAEAHRVSADLIVAGAYGHTRLREWILGGATYDLLQSSNLPLLMAH
ncbi:universal stress protein [Bosea psychrotolerans]|uniref:Universal stress protein family protein n=1 Tax=Bosea psychrotolerans TaxID=1871628 RepID=A0A2S4MLJ8_9HYPH|nr:universal stress protein [Bosea psychrotolerans]POR55541.1 universal stress protein family protein [Bosea psychrotolerans]